MAGDVIRPEHKRDDLGEGVVDKLYDSDPIADISGFLKHLAPKERVTVEAMREGILRKVAEKHRVAAEMARRRGVSLQELLREQLRTLVGERNGKDVAAELIELMRSHGGHSGGRAWRREDAYSGRL